jgi:hypothetical protein
VEVQLVEQARREVLLHGARAAGDRDVLVAGGGAGLVERRLDPVGHERERGLSRLWFGPATKPSSETEIWQATLPMILRPPPAAGLIADQRAASLASSSSRRA